MTRILAIQMNPTVGDILGNAEKILRGIEEGKKRSADIVLFPELALSGYPPEDFLLLPHFMRAIDYWTQKIALTTTGITAIFGAPRSSPSYAEKPLFNSAVIAEDGKIIGYQDKSLLPTYDIFDECRYFESNKHIQLWSIAGKKIAITICEDLWGFTDMVTDTRYQRDPVRDMQPMHPDILLNLSASPYNGGKLIDRLLVCCAPAQELKCPVIFCNQVGGNDQLIFDGHSLYVDAEGMLRQLAKGFEEDSLFVDINSQSDQQVEFSQLPSEEEELFNALVLGVRDYMHKSGFQKGCIGLSGGIDSALVACIAVEALGKENVLGINMPSRYSSEGSIADSHALAKNLDIACKDIPINEPFNSFLTLLDPFFEGKPMDATEENLQARIRGIILMAFSNKFGYIVLSTGNKSEMAMGYATLYGDMCGGLSVLSDVTKDKVYRLSKWINRKQEIIPYNTILKPPSAELRLDQKDSDSLPDYSIVDRILDAYVVSHNSEKEIAEQFGYDIKLVRDLVQRIHRNEYKRRQAAPGLRVSQKSFSIGRRFPIVQKWIQ